MKTFKPAACILIALGFFVTVSCEKDIETETDSDSDSESGNPTLSIIENCENHESADDYIWSSSSEISVVLNGTSITASSSAVTINGSIATITQAGNFNITGTLSNGQIVVNTESEETIRLILNGITVTCAKSAPIYIKKAKKVILVLPDGTQSTLTDGSSYTYDDAEEEEPNAAVFSKSDLSVFGTGMLVVNANFNDGISSKDGLIIKSGSIEVTSKDDGIRGKDYLIIRDGNIKIKSGGDGLKSDNDEDGSKGFINIDKGTFAINSTTDAISAQTDVEVAAGNFTLTSGGGSSSSVSSDVSAKAIKGTVSVILNCESMVISAADDALHTNNYMNIKGALLAQVTVMPLRIKRIVSSH
ncbi:MAG TPA: carbohydrate-binding domain-containing protein, partial [Bacteroidales bacterium]|nr:carbohydrate-binding domain-containing protein [Bacteroidales bacterium]